MEREKQYRHNDHEFVKVVRDAGLISVSAVIKALADGGKIKRVGRGTYVKV